MAIQQVSRITQRKGLAEDLPQPLAGAELGWAIDQRRLYIGNGTLADGAPTVGNTEILTEYSPILEYATAYTYKGAAAGYEAQTGITTGNPITRSLQARLDDFAVVTDFGATGDGDTDDTAAINRALNQLYCVQVNPQIRRGLFFPAGVYRVSNTILVPPYAKLYGEGSDSSVIKFMATVWVSGTAYAEGVLVKSESAGIDVYYRSLIPVPAQLNGSPIPLTNTTYWDSVSLPNYVARTTDSNQEFGLNMGAAGATLPRNVEISSVGFETAEFGNDSSLGHNIWLLEKLQTAYFDSVLFKGPLAQSELDTAVENLAGVRMASSSIVPISQITFDKCKFTNLTYAVNTDVLTKGVAISRSKFDTLFQGIVLGDGAPENGGPTGFAITNNIFDNIAFEGIVMDTCSKNMSAYNIFYNVAQTFLDSSNPNGPIISINAADNVCVGDMFERPDVVADSGFPRIRVYNSSTTSIPATVAWTNGQRVQLGAFTRQSGVQFTLLDNQVGNTIVEIDTSLPISQGGFQAFKMDYTIYRENAGTDAIRTGTLTVVAGGDDSAGEGIVFTDDYVENENTDIILSAEESSNVVSIIYTSGSTGYDGTLYYSLNHFA